MTLVSYRLMAEEHGHFYLALKSTRAEWGNTCDASSTHRIIWTTRIIPIIVKSFHNSAEFGTFRPTMQIAKKWFTIYSTAHNGAEEQIIYALNKN